MSRRATGRRVGWTVIDQSLSSATNFALGILVARSLSRSDFGAFALVFSCYLFLVGLSRAICSEPLLVRHSTENDTERVGAIARSTGTALALGVGFGAVALVMSLIVGSSARASLIVLAVTLPGLLVQDAWRYAFFAQARPSAAAVNDGLWAVTQFALVGALLVTHHSSVALLILAWGVAATVCAGAGCWQARIVPRPFAARAWLRTHRDLAPRFSGEFLAVGGALQASLWIVGIVGGVAAAGALRGGQILIGPLTVLLAAAPAAAIPEGVRLQRRSPTKLMRALAILSISLAGAAFLWGAVIVGMPASIGTALLGASWKTAHPLVLPLALGTVGVGLAIGPIVGLRVHAAASRSLRVRLIVTPITFTLAVAGTIIAGARGAAIGIAIGGWTAALIWWHGFRLASAEASAEIRLPVLKSAEAYEDEFAQDASGR